MRVQILVGIAAGALLLSGCGGSSDPEQTTPPAGDDTTTEATTEPAGDGDTQASGSVDCANITEEEVAEFAIRAQLFAQVRTVDAMMGMEAVGYDPADMAAFLDKLNGLEGVEGEVYGKPDEGLVVFRAGNDTYAAIVAKGDSATDADFAPLDELEPDIPSWINAQASILDALTQACPDLGS